MPSHIEWPLRGDRPLSFIGQIRLEELAPFDASRFLPERGILYFFYDSESQPWGHERADRDAWKVLYHDGPLGDVKPRDPPAIGNADTFAPLPVDFAIDVTLPDFEADEWVERAPLIFRARRDLPPVGRERLAEERKELLLPFFDYWQKVRGPESMPRHRMFGWPDQIQSDMREQCQLASSGIHAGNAEAHRAQGPELRKGTAEWMLLLQVDSDERIGMMWGDMGRIYYWVRRNDLAARNFDSVWLVLQCA